MAYDSSEVAGWGEGASPGLGSSNADMSVEQQYAEYGAGRQLAEIAGGYGLGGPSVEAKAGNYSPTAGTINEVTPSFMEQLTAMLSSPAGKIGRGMLSAALGPAAMLANLGYNLATSKDPLGVALGAIPGVGGFLASTGYGMMKSNDPIGTLGNRALTAAAGYMGNKVAGPYGGAMASNMAGRAMASNGGFSLTGGGNGLASLGMLNEGHGDGNDWNQLIKQNFNQGQPA